MVQSVIQHGFHAGEWAPALYARVDLAKYKAGAALLENFYVDYRGGASSRPGTKYCMTAAIGALPVRLIPFQASSTIGYVLEFGDFYVRFFFQGAPVLETALNITNVSGSTVTVANTFANTDQIYITGVNGINNINGKFFIVSNVTGAGFDATDLFGNTVTFTGAYVSGGTVARIYNLGTPYASADLALLKFTQNINKMYLCHPNYPPNVLTIISAANWTIGPIVIGSTLGAVTGLAAATTNAGNAHYGYVVTAVDANGQESNSSTVVYQTVNIAAASISTVNLTWTGVTGALSYNVYRTPARDGADPPAGSTLGFIMNVTGVAASDMFIAGVSQNLADFQSSVPIPKNPFGPPGVASATITAPGAYTSCPAVTFAAPGTGVTAVGSSVLGALSFAVTGSSTGNAVGDILSLAARGTKIIVTSVNGFGNVLTADIFAPGAISSGSTPGNPVIFTRSGGFNATGNLTWGVIAISITNPGLGYTSPPAITFSSGAAAATAVLQPDTSGNPSVPGLFQQRLVLAAKPNSVQTFDMSQTASYFNFDIRNPIQADDAIEGTIVDGQLNKIVSMVSVPTGLVLLTSKANWLISSSGGAVSPIDIQAHAHSYNGASDVPPIISNFDILFVQAKNSIVRDLTFNFYTQIYTGTDISVLSSHLFYGHNILEWSWAEEPFKVVWAVREDGVALAMTYVKEQELIGWAHSVTDGQFTSTAVVTEQTATGLVDAVYFVVERDVGPGIPVKYIERLAERQFPNGAADAWCVDAGLQYNGAPATSFSGGEHLKGKIIVGLADGVPITPFVMPTSGSFTLPTPASKVTVGLAFLPKLQTLPLDIGEPTIAAKRKGINGVTVRVQDTLGLYIGKDFDTGVPMKDLVLGNVGSATNEVVTGLVTADARTIIDPSWDVPGQYCIKQPNPLPVTILGVIPEIEVGDTK